MAQSKHPDFVETEHELGTRRGGRRGLVPFRVDRVTADPRVLLAPRRALARPGRRSRRCCSWRPWSGAAAGGQDWPARLVGEEITRRILKTAPYGRGRSGSGGSARRPPTRGRSRSCAGKSRTTSRRVAGGSRRCSWRAHLEDFPHAERRGRVAVASGGRSERASSRVCLAKDHTPLRRTEPVVTPGVGFNGGSTRAAEACTTAKIALDADRIVAGKALLRWDHTERGLLRRWGHSLRAGPGVSPIGAWLLEEACAQPLSWQYTVPQRTSLVRRSTSVDNRTGHHRVVHRALCARHKQVALYGITEGLLMDNSKRRWTSLAVAGSGSLVDDDSDGVVVVRLKQFPVNEIKIDRRSSSLASRR